MLLATSGGGRNSVTYFYARNYACAHFAGAPTLKFSMIYEARFCRAKGFPFARAHRYERRGLAVPF